MCIFTVCKPTEFIKINKIRHKLIYIPKPHELIIQSVVCTYSSSRSTEFPCSLDMGTIEILPPHTFPIRHWVAMQIGLRQISDKRGPSFASSWFLHMN